MMAQTKSKSRSSHRRIISALHFPNLEPSPHYRESTGAPRSPKRTPYFLSTFLALTHFMRLSLMKAAYAGVGGAPCRKSGYVGRKRWAQPNDRFRCIDSQIHISLP